MTSTSSPVAAIDIGSNAVRMLVGDRDGRATSVHLFVRVPLGLGREVYGGDKTISPAAQRRLTDALDGLQKIARSMNASPCRAIATAAIRDCRNRKQVLANIRRLAGVTIHVLDGDEEASLIGLFVARQFPPRATVLNIDTGGGSTDCAVIKSRKMLAHATFSVGTARSGGGSAAEKTKMTSWLQQWRDKNPILAASGGSARKMEEICGDITPARLNSFLRRAESMTAAQRARVFDLAPDRARNIVPAARIGKLVLRACGASKIQTISGGLGEAVLETLLADKR